MIKSTSFFNGAVVLLNINAYKDLRGTFAKTYNSNVFADLGLPIDWKEDFYSVSKKGVIRGMHYQAPPADHHKMIFCLSGEIQDVVLDLRKNSTTYGQYISIELSGSRSEILIIPSGFAHGFCALSEEAVTQYKVTSVYSPENDTGVLWSSFGCTWLSKTPIVSERDQALPEFQTILSPF
jgi:dTDP-4-dehydrorhamnose 3,5-epimerase